MKRLTGIRYRFKKSEGRREDRKKGREVEQGDRERGRA